jgi:hypothetical protein
MDASEMIDRVLQGEDPKDVVAEGWATRAAVYPLKIAGKATVRAGVALGSMYVMRRSKRAIDRHLDYIDHRERTRIGIRSPHTQYEVPPGKSRRRSRRRR